MTPLFEIMQDVAAVVDDSNDNLRTSAFGLEWEVPVFAGMPSAFRLAQVAFAHLGEVCRGVEVRPAAVVIYLTNDYNDDA